MWVEVVMTHAIMCAGSPGSNVSVINSSFHELHVGQASAEDLTCVFCEHKFCRRRNLPARSSRAPCGCIFGNLKGLINISSHRCFRSIIIVLNQTQRTPFHAYPIYGIGCKNVGQSLSGKIIS